MINQSSLFPEIRNGEEECIPPIHTKRETKKVYCVLTAPPFFKNSTFFLSLASPIDIFLMIIIKVLDIEIDTRRGM